MGIKGIFFWIVGAIVLSLAATSLRAIETLVDAQDERFEVRLEALYEDLPRRGVYPLRLKVWNKTREPQRWTVEGSSIVGYRPRFETSGSQTVQVEPGGWESFELMMPIAASNDAVDGIAALGNGGFRGALLGPDFHQAFTGNGIWFDPSLAPSFSSTGVGNDLSFDPIQDKHSRELDFAVVFTRSSFSVDWRAYECFDQILLSVKMWRSLDLVTQYAVMRWVGNGGHLYLIGSDALDANDRLWKDVQPQPEGSFSFGLGEVFERKTMDQQQFEALLSKAQGSFAYSKFLSHGMVRFLADKSYSSAGHFVALIAFLVLVGPVNLGYFCRGRSRHRVFFTTPLIVLGFVALSLGYAVFKDGIGGEGERYRLSVFNPGERFVSRIQGQVAEMGLILNRYFELPEDAAMRDMIGIGQVDASYAVENHELSGDWFRSRTRHAHLLAWVEPSRESIRIERSSDGRSWTARSRIKGTLQPFVFRDRDGKLWMADSLTLGEDRALVPVLSGSGEKDPLEAALGDAAGRPYEDLIRMGMRDPNSFAGILTQEVSQPVDTLSSVRWLKDTHFAFGQAILTQEEGR